MSRDEVLGTIRAALSDVPSEERPGDVPIPRDYQRAGVERPEVDELVEVLTGRLLGYRSEVVRVDTRADKGSPKLAQVLGDICRERGWSRVVMPLGLSPDRRPEGVQIVIDDPSLSPEELDAVDAAVTECALAVAETGTLVLDGSAGCGRRAISLVPDVHIALVPRERIVKSVPDAVASLDFQRALTLISGPSATSDIELQRVEGVHGPRTLLAVVI